jgi:uncharacterized short protein YbdD (DUF466 family)
MLIVDSRPINLRKVDSWRADSRRTMGCLAVLSRLWRGIREWCGDAAYEKYVRSCAKHRPENELLSREEFYVQQLQRKYSRISRCC